MFGCTTAMPLLRLDARKNLEVAVAGVLAATITVLWSPQQFANAPSHSLDGAAPSARVESLCGQSGVVPQGHLRDGTPLPWRSWR